MTTEERNRLLEENIPAIRYAVNKARHKVGFTPQSYTDDDLFQLASIAALTAIEDYIPSGITLAEYLKYIVAYRLVDIIRTSGIESRANLRHNKRFAKIKTMLGNKLGRYPTSEEIAEEANITLAKYHLFTKRTTRKQVYSLTGINKTDYSVVKPVNMQIPTGEPSVLQKLEEQELLEAIHSGIDKLEKRDQYVLKEYFEENKTCRKIGKQLTLNESRISQIKIRALKRLKIHIKEFYEIPNNSMSA